MAKNFPDYYNAGNFAEDVINVLYQISPTLRPVTGSVAHIGADSAIKEFLTHELAAPNKDNARIDGAAPATDSTSEAVRLKQPMQLTEHKIELGAQALNSDSFGNIASFEQQLQRRVQETYRDQEAAALSENASVYGVSGTTAAKQAGFFAQISTNTNFGAGGSDGGWNPGTGIFDAPTPGTTRPLSEADILTVMQAMNIEGSMMDCMTMVPELKSRFSAYMMTSSSRIGTLVTQAPGGEGGATAVAGVSVYDGDFGILQVKNNNIMQKEAADRTNLAIYQENMLEVSDQWTARGERLAKNGHGEQWLVSSSFGLLALNEKAHGAVRDVNPTVAMTA